MSIMLVKDFRRKYHKGRLPLFLSIASSCLDFQNQVQGRVLPLSSSQVSLYCRLSLIHCSGMLECQSAGIYKHTFRATPVYV